jgi:hypothetical protein
VRERGEPLAGTRLDIGRLAEDLLAS